MDNLSEEVKGIKTFTSEAAQAARRAELETLREAVGKVIDVHIHIHTTHTHTHRTVLETLREAVGEVIDVHIDIHTKHRHTARCWRRCGRLLAR